MILNNIEISRIIYRKSKAFKIRVLKDRLLSVFDWIYIRSKWLVKILSFFKIDRVFRKFFKKVEK